MVIKCYDYNGRLWVSKPCTPNSRKFFQLLHDAEHVLKAKCAFVKDGKLSYKINFAQKQKTVDRRYIGHDGKITWTIPIRLSAYPLN